ncbi:MAG: TonB family protein [Candidatus Acidiferrales bacterium]|jgi:TonB family protein
MKLIFRMLAIIVLLSVLTKTTPNVTAQEPRILQKPVTILTPTGGVDFNQYIIKMLKAVKQDWNAAMPDAARAGQKGKTVVQFRILRNGKAKRFSIEVSSGSDVLDKAAIKGIRDSSPFDPLPPAFKGRYIDLRMVFLYNLPLEYGPLAAKSNTNSKPLL